MILFLQSIEMFRGPCGQRRFKISYTHVYYYRVHNITTHTRIYKNANNVYNKNNIK